MDGINVVYSSNNFELLQEFLDNIIRNNSSYLRYFGSTNEWYENFEKYVKSVFIENKELQKLFKKIEFYKKQNGKSSKQKLDFHFELVEKQLIKSIEEYISLQKIENTTNIFKQKIADIITNVWKVFLSKKELIKKTVFTTALTATLFAAWWVWAEYDAELEYMEQSRLRLAEIQKQTEQKIANITIDPEVKEEIFYKSVSNTNHNAKDFFIWEGDVAVDDLNLEQTKVLFISIYWYWIATEYLFNFAETDEKTKTLLANIIALHYKETWGNFGFCAYWKDPTYNKTWQENIWVTQISTSENVMQKYLEENLRWLNKIQSDNFTGDIDNLNKYIQIIKNKLNNVWTGWNEETVKIYFDKLEKELDLSKEQIELITMIWFVEDRNKMFGYDWNENIWVWLTNPNLSEDWYILYVSERMQWWRKWLWLGVKKIKENNAIDNNKIAMISRWWKRQVQLEETKIKQEKIKQIKQEEAELIEKEWLSITQ